MGFPSDGQGIPSTLALLLKRSGKHKCLLIGQQVHNHIYCIGYDSSRFLANWVIQMYGECGYMEDAKAVFNNIYSQNMHSWSILLNMYAQNGRLEDAICVFEKIPERTAVPWNAIMTAHIQHGLGRKVVDFFRRIICESVEPDNVSFVCAVDGCSSLEVGKQMHIYAAESGCVHDCMVGTALLTMYGRWGCIEQAKIVFGTIVNRDISCWNAMIAAFAQNDHGREALDLFAEMQSTGLQPDVITFVSVLNGCASLSTFGEGHAIHFCIIDTGIEIDRILGTALVDMYGKCGSIQDACNVFWRTSHENAIAWNAIIGASAQNGHGQEALTLFSQMQLDCIKPDDATFVSILTACCYAGLVNIGWYYFLSMAMDHGIKQNMDHYACMIDLLGRAGQLDEAEHLLQKIPLKADDVTWRALLAACQFHFDADRGIRIAKRCLALDPEDATPYVSLFNILAGAGNGVSAKVHA